MPETARGRMNLRKKFEALIVKRSEVLYHLAEFFSKPAPMEQMSGKSVLSAIQNAAPVPAYWTKVVPSLSVISPGDQEENSNYARQRRSARDLTGGK
jgi:hypothetical protein